MGANFHLKVSVFPVHEVASDASQDHALKAVEPAKLVGCVRRLLDA